MNLQEMIDGQMAKERLETLKKSPQLCLGELAARLESVDPNLEVELDFGARPTTLDSWRGSYCEVAIGFTEETDKVLAGDFAKSVSASIGATYQGYKGGDFLMGRTTPVWVANYGHSYAKDYEDDCRGVVGVRVDGGKVVIDTAPCEL